jgi:hypothetical protein
MVRKNIMMNTRRGFIGGTLATGMFRFYTAGDFSGPPEFPEVEKAIGKATGKVDVAKIKREW